MFGITRILNVFRRRRLDDDLRQEIETHLALIKEEGRANGLTADQADREARSRSAARSLIASTPWTPSSRRGSSTR
jgi:hypothetical protein